MRGISTFFHASESYRRVMTGDPGLSEQYEQGSKRIQRLRAKARENTAQLSEARQSILDEVQRLLRKKRWTDSRRECPECSKPFIVLDVKDVPVDFCRGCRSFWFDSGELSQITELFEDIPGQNLAHRRSSLACCVCGEQMQEFQFTRGDNLLVDRCPLRHGVYLQDQELGRALLAADKKGQA